MIHHYTPEMGGTIDKTKVQTHARLAHYGRHYFLKSIHGPDKIKGRGVEYMGRLMANPSPDPLLMERRIDATSEYVGYYEYKVTLKAFEKLGEQIEIGNVVLLD